MDRSSGRKRKQHNPRKLVDDLRDEVSQLRRELRDEVSDLRREKEKRNPSSLVKENHTYFRNSVKQELSKYDWSGKNVNVRAGDFSGSDMRDLDFAGMNAVDAIFRDTDLKGAKFEGANLKGADFTGAEFDRFTSFRGANVSGALFSLEDLDLLLRLGLDRDRTFKLAFKEKGSVSVQNIDLLMKTIYRKFEGVLDHTLQLLDDEEDALEKAKKEHGASFNPLVHFEFDFKRRAKPITKEFKRLRNEFDVPSALIHEYSVNYPMEQIEKLVKEGLKREKARSKAQSKSWREWIPFF